MSGGHFDYKQYCLSDMAQEIDQLILSNDSLETNEYGDVISRNYPNDIIAEFKKASEMLKLCEIYVQRIDWLHSGDDGVDCFRRKLKEELQKHYDNKK